MRDLEAENVGTVSVTLNATLSFVATRLEALGFAGRAQAKELLRRAALETGDAIGVLTGGGQHVRVRVGRGAVDHVARDPHCAGGVCDHLFREAADTESAIHDLTSAREPRAPVCEPARHDLVGVHAERVLVAHAPITGPARRSRREHHAISGHEPDDARGFHDRMGQTWPIALDDQGRTAFGFGVFGVPETFFVGPDGIIRGRHIGAIDEETLIRGIEAIRPKN